MNYDYDYFVIGAGSAGVRSARIAGGHGAKVAIAEYGPLGGTCVNVGCVPKKLLAYASDFGPSFEDAKGFGWSAGDINFDWNKLIQNKNAEIERLNGIYNTLLDNAGVTLYEGHASFIDDHTIEVDGKTYTAENILIATGGQPFVPDVPGKELLKTSNDMFYLDDLPQRAVIIGGGYIGVEFAHILHGMGAEVTLIYRGPKILRGFDEDVSDFLMEELTKQGIQVCTNCDLQSAEQDGDGVIIHTSTGKSYKGDIALAATGRLPNTADLALDKAGITPEANGRIAVNEDYQTAQPHIYALGDVANRHNLTPIATAEGHVLADTLFNNQKDRRVDYTNIPTAVFSNPPIGTVGLSEEAARKKEFDIDIYKTDFTPMKHTLSGRDEKTMMKLIVDQKTDKVIGLHIVGADAPEMLQGFAVAINAGATKADFDRTIGIHPTSAEEFVTMRTKSSS